MYAEEHDGTGLIQTEYKGLSPTEAPSFKQPTAESEVEVLNCTRHVHSVNMVRYIG